MSTSLDADGLLSLYCCFIFAADLRKLVIGSSEGTVAYWAGGIIFFELGGGELLDTVKKEGGGSGINRHDADEIVAITLRTSSRLRWE